MKIYDRGGIIHLHSTLSDGNATVEEIIECGKASGLDFIILTDHDTLAARDAGLEGWHEGLLLLVGYEISPPKNHYLALGTEEVVGSDKIEPQEYIDDVADAGGLGIIAHPHHRGVSHFNLPSYAWQRWDVQGYDAMGIWDLMTDWQNSIKSKLSAIKSILFPPRVLHGPEAESLQQWDEINRNREKPLPGIGECDNHGLPVRLLCKEIKILPYSTALRLVHTRLQLTEDLCGDVTVDHDRVLEAIRLGRCYVAQEWWLSASGFMFSYHHQGDVTLPAVSLHEWQGGKFVIDLPHKGRIRLLCNGEVMSESTATEMVYEPERAGVWRTEVLAFMGGRYRPWVFSNPILLK